MKAKLKNISEWSKNNKDGSIRLYCGSMYCGTAYPAKLEDVYSFKSSNYSIISVSTSYKTLDKIKDEIELCLKEFLSQICI